MKTTFADQEQMNAGLPSHGDAGHLKQKFVVLLRLESPHVTDDERVPGYF
jgi:hypothetical protein